MEIETGSYNRSTVHGGTTPSAETSAYEEWRCIIKVSLNCICETFAEKQLQFQPYSACTVEYCNRYIQGACLRNVQVECSEVGDRVGMRRREKTQSFMAIPSCICSENLIELQPNTACLGKAQFTEMETICDNRSTVNGGSSPSVDPRG